MSVPPSPAPGVPTRPSALEAAAREVLPPGLYGYVAGSAGDEVTLRESVAAWQAWAPRGRALVDVSQRSLAVDLLGSPAPPLLVAPMAGQALVHPGGEVGLSEAAAAVGVPYVLSSRSSVPVGEVTAGRRWLQLYVLRDRAVSTGLVRDAVQAGFEAVVLTVDAPVLGWRDREVGVDVPGPGPAVGAGVRQDPALVWDDLAALVASAGVPVLVKGVLEATDAVRAVELGAAGVIVSAHGGRQLDGCVPPAVALPEVVGAVGAWVPVLVDGGIRRGTDVLVALALGASAVLVGRPVMWGLAVGGPVGASQVLQQLLDELSIALALVGVPDARDLSMDVLRPATWRR